MTDPWKIIKQLESDNSRLFKEDVIKQHLHDSTFQEGLAMCLDALVTFGVKQVPEKKEETSDQGCKWSNFKVLTNQLIDDPNKITKGCRCTTIMALKIHIRFMSVNVSSCFIAMFFRVPTDGTPKII